VDGGDFMSDNKDNPAENSGEVTQLLQRWAGGDASALDSLWPMVYEDVRKLARRQLAAERSSHTLQGTALVNEAFIKLAGQHSMQWQNREQFLSLASQIMRRVLVDYARRRGALRRGRGAKRVSIDDTHAALELDDAQTLLAFEDESIDLLAIDTALTRLEKIDAPQSRIVELRYFGGLTIEETATVAGISPASVKREWTIARAWLRRELSTIIETGSAS
jgi:RNA polymerase sigma factor (TIGR02999 family)